jgi:hypothetical protein
MPFYPLICFNYLQIQDALHRRIDRPGAAETGGIYLWIRRWRDGSDPLREDRCKLLNTDVPAGDDAAVADDGDVAAAESDGNAAHNDHEPKRGGIPGEAVRWPRSARSRLQPRPIKLQLKPYA